MCYNIFALYFLGFSVFSQDGLFYPHYFNRVLPFNGQHITDCTETITLQPVTVVMENGELLKLHWRLNHENASVF